MSLEADVEYYPVHESRDSTIVKSSIGAVLENNGTIDVDCGIDIEISAGYKINSKPVERFSEQGILVVSSRIEKNRLIITLVNLGKQKVELKKGDLFARISIAPIYEFEWYSKKDYQ